MIGDTSININNENCIDAMFSGRMDDSVNVVLTSPFYNTNKKAGHNGTIGNTGKKEENYEYVRYDMHTDDLTNDEYDEFTVKLFEGEGIIHHCHCVNCGAEIEYFIAIPDEETEGGEDEG